MIHLLDSHPTHLLMFFQFQFTAYNGTPEGDQLDVEVRITMVCGVKVFFHLNLQVEFFLDLPLQTVLGSLVRSYLVIR